MLRKIIRALWIRKWILIAVPVVTASLVFAVRYFDDWIYTSTAQISTGITMSSKLLDKGNRLAPDEMEIEFNNLVEVIKSPTLINQVSFRALQHDLPASSYSFRRPSDKLVRENLGAPLNAYESTFRQILDKKLDSIKSLNLASEDERLLQKLVDLYRYNYESVLKNLNIRRINNSDYLELKFSSENPQLSAFMVNTVCSELIRYYTSLQQSQSTESLESLLETLGQRKTALDEKLELFQGFHVDNEIINTDVQSLSRLNQIKQYEDQISAEQQRVRGLELTLASLTVRIQDAEGSSGRLNDDVVSIRTRIGSFNERYIQGGQKDQQLLDSITALRARLDEIYKRIEQAPKYTPGELKALKDRRDQTGIDLEVGRANLASLNRTLTSLQNNMSGMAGQEATRKNLEEEVRVAREAFLAAQLRYTEAKEKLRANTMNIKQVMLGEPASKPQIRNAVILIASSALASFLLCAFIVLIREMNDSRIRTPQRLKVLARIPNVGILPHLPRSIKNPSWSFFIDASSRTEDLHRLNDELRKIRYAIENSNAQIFLVTSTQKAQGKSFFVMALAYTLSLARKRTLVIDTNLRHNSLTRLLTARVNLKQSIDYYHNSMKQLTTGSAEGDTSLESAKENNLITRTHNDFVDVIGNKSSHLSPSEVIPADDFKILLKWLRVQYDFIILEGANLNDYSDSQELIGFVDQVIPVFSADAELTEEDKNSLNFIRSLNGKLGMGILNKVMFDEGSKAAAVF